MQGFLAWKSFTPVRSMRARQRHFNPKNAAAIVALDSRFMPEQADGSAVSSWPDRLGGTANDFSQGTGASQPAYTLNAINGNPAVRFNGDFMSTAVSFGTNNSIGGDPAVTIVSVHNKTNSANGSFVGWGDSGSSLGACGIYNDNTFNNFEFAGGNSAPMTTLSANTTVITVVKKPSGAINASSRFRNGTSVATGSASSGTPNINGNQSCVIGRWANYTPTALTGDLAYLLIFNVELSDSLQRRFESSAAFSFKIACS